MSRSSLNLRHARARRRSRPVVPRRRAHTAGGHDILGLWAWIERVVLLATFASIALGVVAFLIDFEDRKQARVERRQEAITRAWSLITTPATGNSGKGPALEYLNGLRISLQDIDLSCERMGGGWSQDDLTCENGTYLWGVWVPGADLSGAQFQGANLRSAQFPDAYLEYAQFQGANLWGANFQDANLRSAQFQDAVLLNAHFPDADLEYAQFQDANLEYAQFQGANLRSAQFQDAYLEYAHFQGAELLNAQFQDAELLNAQFQDAVLLDAQFQGANLSSADFTGAGRLDTARFRDPATGLTAWAWADRPPVGLEGIAIDLCVYDGDLHYREIRPDPCVPPSE